MGVALAAEEAEEEADSEGRGDRGTTELLGVTGSKKRAAADKPVLGSVYPKAVSLSSKNCIIRRTALYSDGTATAPPALDSLEAAAAALELVAAEEEELAAAEELTAEVVRAACDLRPPSNKAVSSVWHSARHIGCATLRAVTTRSNTLTLPLRSLSAASM